MGEAGVRHVMKSLLADFDILMNVGGFQNIQQIDRSALGGCFSDVIMEEVADFFGRILSQGLRDDGGEIQAIEVAVR